MATVSDPDSILQRTLVYAFNVGLFFVSGVIAGAMLGSVGFMVVYLALPEMAPFYLGAVFTWAAIMAPRAEATVRGQPAARRLAEALEEAREADEDDGGQDESDEGVTTGVWLLAAGLLYYTALFGLTSAVSQAVFTSAYSGVWIVPFLGILEVETRSIKVFGRSPLTTLFDATFALLSANLGTPEVRVPTYLSMMGVD